MFIVSSDRKKVVDFSGRVVGYLKGDKFLQNDGENMCDPYYSNGLHPLEMEQVSEAIQKVGYRNG